jgi:hypothetical protein
MEVHKDTVMVAVRRPTADGKGREQEIRQYRTLTSALGELRAWLAPGVRAAARQPRADSDVRVRIDGGVEMGVSDQGVEPSARRRSGG